MVAKHINGYTSFYTDITKEILVGEENQILVFVENKNKPNSRWYTGTGIYRHVWLHIGEKIHTQPWMLHAETKKIENDKAYMSIRSTVSNLFGMSQQATVLFEILDMEKKVVYTYSENCEPAFLDICDKLGMLVIEEAFDAWVLAKRSFYYNIFFEKYWEEDITSMINRDFNHPSIIMWSTGNEVDERDGSADGYEWSRKLARKVKSLDSGRAVTASACSILEENESAYVAGNDNLALNMLDSSVDQNNDVWGKATEQFFEPLDTSGSNYKVGRYSYDKKRFPNRVIYGSETFPSKLFESWGENLKNPNVIGDFVWTAIDYLGEAGVGYVTSSNTNNDFKIVEAVKKLKEKYKKYGEYLAIQFDAKEFMEKWIDRTFSKVFKKYEWITPLEYRNNNRIK